MVRVDGRERALSDIIGGGEYSATKKPGAVVLPKLVHLRTLEAIELTESDKRERKIGFRYRRGSWHAGVTKTGKAGSVRADGSYVNATAGTSLLVGRPHLHMHTHPEPDLGTTQKAVELRPRTQAWSPSKKAALANKEHTVHRGDYMLPSGGDIDSMYSISLGSVGNMIASTGGIFLSLRDDVRDRELLIHNDPDDVSYKIAVYRELRQVAMDKRLSAAVTHKIILGAAADLLSHRYACYFNSDPENPQLERVQ